MKYSIQALKCGEQLVPGPEMFHMAKWDEWIKVYMYVWFITDGEKKILVDTAMRNIDEVNPIIVSRFGEKAKFEMADDEDICSVLKKVKTTPEEIDCLILTHFHYDHISNAKLFSKARVIISGKGWMNTLAPKHKSLTPPVFFPRDVLSYLVKEAWDRVYLASDENEIMPGIKVFWVGGHTMGSQAISVETEKGKAVLTGDVVFRYENIEKNIPVGLCYNLIECLDAMERIRKEADIILPGHDPEIVEKFPDGEIV